MIRQPLGSLGDGRKGCSEVSVEPDEIAFALLKWLEELLGCDSEDLGEVLNAFA